METDWSNFVEFTLFYSGYNEADEHRNTKISDLADEQVNHAQDEIERFRFQVFEDDFEGALCSALRVRFILNFLLGLIFCLRNVRFCFLSLIQGGGSRLSCINECRIRQGAHNNLIKLFDCFLGVLSGSLWSLSHR